MATGYRSPLWLLGISGSSPPPAAGYRGLLGLWIGGASARGGPPAPTAGFRGLLAPWLGGAGRSAGFPTQYAGFDVIYQGELNHICLVAEADAPGGMGGVLKVRINGVNYAMYLVEEGDAHASDLRVRTSTGTKAIRLKT